MINLIAPQAKKSFVAGRVNTVLVRYLWIIAVLMGILIAMMALAYIMLNTLQLNAENEIKENEAQSASLQSVQTKASEFQASLAASKSILDQQTSYSSSILKIANLIPSGAIISSITLDASTFGTPIDIQVLTVSPYKAIEVKEAFQRSTLFTSVQFKGVTSNEPGTGTSTKYPVTAQLQVIVNKAVAGQ